MKSVERVRYAMQIEWLSHRDAARRLTHYQRGGRHDERPADARIDAGELGGGENFAAGTRSDQKLSTLLERAERSL
jgi:hypothetical protein